MKSFKLRKIGNHWYPCIDHELGDPIKMCIRDRIMSKLKEQILILRSDNKSYNEIAKILGCSKSIVAVSYTHLDVYKRQQQRKEKMAYIMQVTMQLKVQKLQKIY